MTVKNSSKPDLHNRYREYLGKFKLGVDFTVDEATWIKKTKLKQVALSGGYTLKQISVALKALDNDVDIANVWSSKERAEFFCRIPMTALEIKQHKEDDEWFESLPG